MSLPHPTPDGSSRHEVALPTDTPEPVARRRRLNSKSRAADIEAPPRAAVGDAMLPAAAPMDVVPRAPDVPGASADESIGACSSESPWGKAAQNAFYGFISRWQRRIEAAAPMGADFALVRQPLRKLSLEERARVVSQWAAEDQTAPLDLRQAAVGKFCLRAQKGPNTGRWLHAAQALLTWQGPWGLLSLADVGLTKPCSVDELCPLLSALGRVRSMRDSVHSALRAWMMEYGIGDAAYSIEVCTATYLAAIGCSESATDDTMVGRWVSGEAEPVAVPAPEGRPIRLHVHMYLRSGRGKVSVQRQESLSLFGSLPVKSSLSGPSGTRGMPRGNQGMYYLQCPKIGMVANGGTALPYQGYLVNGDWAFNLLQQGKMSLENCRLEIIRSAKNLPRLLQNLDRVMREREAQGLSERVAAVASQLALQRRPFRSLRVVTQWLESFRALKPRYEFLVLEGPSQVGKTQFARSLSPAGPSGVFEADCAASDYPDIRGFRSGVHDTIIFDEASATLVARHKKMFQASASWVSLGASATNIHSYMLWLHGVRMIVTSNTWMCDVRRMPAEDAAWLQRNSVHVWVQEPLFL